MRLTTRTLVIAAVVAACGLTGLLATSGGRRAQAHPLGNFTINHYTRIDVSDSGIDVLRVLDMAEIPALQERQRIDTDDDGQVDAAESDAFAARRAEDLREGITLRAGREAVALAAVSHSLAFPDGQAGLSTLRLEVTYHAPLPEGWRGGPLALTFDDRNYADRQGWREVVVRGGRGVEIAQGAAPAASVSDELRAYPEDVATPDVRSVSFGVSPGAGAPLAELAHPDEDEAVRGNPDSTLSRFTGLIAKDDLSAGVIALALVAAAGFGALHALSPGHGKTVVAAYLVGSRGTAWHALFLALVVTATHTSSVYALGFVTLYLSQYVVPEDLYPWLGIASGALILSMGLSLLYVRLRAAGAIVAAARWLRLRAPAFRSGPLVLAPAVASTPAAPAPGSRAGEQHAEVLHASRYDGTHAHPHEHVAHDARDGDGAHRHGIGPAHSHRIPGQDGQRVTLRSLVGLGVFGGMIPCPSAIVVMLSAIALHRVGFGLVLIVAFSLGLAAVLTAIGFALVFGRALAARIQFHAPGGTMGGIAAFAARALPVGGAAAVVVAGLVVMLRALAQQGTL